jgi:L-lactate dehydrogenase complex protein LldE
MPVTPMRISLFITCFNDTLSPGTGVAMVRLLERLGHEVEFREQQTCCGQLHLNSGYRDEARALARRFVRVFDGAEVIVSPSASCVGTVRDAYPALLGDEAGSLPGRVLELTELLTGRLELGDVGASYPHAVCYHPTCHSLRGLGLGAGPERLLAGVRGLRLMELEDSGQCCGFGGTFAVKNADVSGAMLADTLDRIERSGAEIVTAVDTSCLMQIGGGLRRRRSPVGAVHIAEILAS